MENGHKIITLGPTWGRIALIPTCEYLTRTPMGNLRRVGSRRDEEPSRAGAGDEEDEREGPAAMEVGD